MKLKNEVFERGILTSLEKLKGQNLPVKEGFKIVKLFDELSEKQKQYLESKNALIKKYGKQKKNSQTEIPKKQMDDFKQEMQELLDIEQEYSDFKIDLPEAMNLTPSDLAILKDFLNI